MATVNKIVAAPIVGAPGAVPVVTEFDAVLAVPTPHVLVAVTVNVYVVLALNPETDIDPEPA